MMDTGAHFQGLWISDDFGEITLTQQQEMVTGSYTGRGSGVLHGAVSNGRLDFTWDDSQTSAQMCGWGFLRSISGGRTLSGMWGYRSDKTQQTPLLAELLMRPLAQLGALDLSGDEMTLKQQGYNYFNQGYYDRAIPFLEASLRKYQALHEQAQQRESILMDRYLVDIGTLHLYLLQCYFYLADYHGVSEHPQVRQQIGQLYHTVITYLDSATTTYQLLFLFTVRKAAQKPLQAIRRNALTIGGWQETVQQFLASLPADDQRLLLGHALLQQLALLIKHLAQAKCDLEMYDEKPITNSDRAVQALHSLAEYVLTLHKQVTDESDQLNAHAQAWVEPQRSGIQNMAFLLTAFAVELEGAHRLILQALSDARNRLMMVSSMAFNLSQWIERWRLRLATDADRILAHEQGQSFFSKLIQLFIDAELTETALVISERARARAFIDLLVARTLTTGDVTEQRPTQLSSVVPLIEIADIFALARQRQGIIIEYFVTDRSLIIWVISAIGTITTHISPVSKQTLDTTIDALVILLQERTTSATQRQQITHYLKELYLYLFAPIPRERFSSADEPVITIIPHGKLFLVPFCALQEPGGRYLIQDYAIVYAPSIHLLNYTHENKKKSIHADNPDLLALVSPEPLPLAEPHLQPLDFTAREFDVIASFYAGSQHTTILKGEDVVRANFLSDIGNYAVLYFATHAEAFEKEPLQSYLALAAIPPNAGYLRVPEIFQFTLHADLVILAACQTGRGEVTGDGVNGLSRAFIAAGSPSLIMTLWSAFQEESLTQMAYFHLHWRQGNLSKAQALRYAQLESLKEHPEEPRVWAIFALFGEWQ